MKCIIGMRSHAHRRTHTCTPTPTNPHPPHTFRDKYAPTLTPHLEGVAQGGALHGDDLQALLIRHIRQHIPDQLQVVHHDVRGGAPHSLRALAGGQQALQRPHPPVGSIPMHGGGQQAQQLIPDGAQAVDVRARRVPVLALRAGGGWEASVG